MRIRFASTEQPSTIAKSLKKLLGKEGVDVPLSSAQNTVGQMLGYRNWHEMAVSTKIHAPASAFDEQVDELERTARRERQIAALLRDALLPREKAERVVDALRPTAARRPGKLANYARLANERLEAMRRPDGFVGFDPSTWVAPAGAPAYTTTYHDLTITAWVTVVDKRKRIAVPARFEVVAHRGEAVVGIMRGVSASARLQQDVTSLPREGRYDPKVELLNKIAMYRMSDAFTSSFPGIGDPLSMTETRNVFSLGSIHELAQFTGYVVVTEWEVAKPFVPAETGLALQKAAWNAYDAMRLGRSTMIIEAVPVQFAGMPMGTRETRADFIAAFNKISDCFSRIIDEPDTKVPSFCAAFGPRIADGEISTTTLASEPKPIEPEDWPVDHDQDYAEDLTTPIEFAPHPLFWSSMPTDLVRVYLDQWGSTEQTEPIIYNFVFANGTQLTLHPECVREAWEGDVLPNVLKDAKGRPLRTNPFTDKMSVPDMMAVIARNIYLAYSSGPVAKTPEARSFAISRP